MPPSPSASATSSSSSRALSGRPDHIIEKMGGKAACASSSRKKAVGASIEVAGMARLLLGEGVEKEETDFAAEVAAAVKG